MCLQKPDSAGKRVATPQKRRVEEIAVDDSEHEYNPLESDVSEPESVPQVSCCFNTGCLSRHLPSFWRAPLLLLLRSTQRRL